MAKLSDFKDEKALDVMADLLEPLAEILSDPALKSAYERKANKLKLVKLAIKNHKRAVIEILAILDDTPVEDYHVNLLTLPAKILEILNDEEFTQLFTTQGQPIGSPNSGSATGNTPENAM